MIKKFLCIVAGLLLLTCCQEDETIRKADEVISFSQITVSHDDFANTRVHFNDAKKVVWNENDTIGVYSDTDGIVPFVYLSGNTFASNQTVKGNQFYAFYPYSNWPFNWIYMRPITVDDSNILHIYMPEGNVRELWDRQDVISSIWKNTIPMVAKSADNHFSFKQTMGVLHFTVKDIAQITGVVVVANNKEPMYGFASIDMSATNPILSLDEIDGYGGYGLSYKYDNVKLEEGETFDAYIPVPVGTYSKGFTVTINGLNANGVTFPIPASIIESAKGRIIQNINWL